MVVCHIHMFKGDSPSYTYIQGGLSYDSWLVVLLVCSHIHIFKGDSTPANKSIHTHTHAHTHMQTHAHTQINTPKSSARNFSCTALRCIYLCVCAPRNFWGMKPANKCHIYIYVYIYVYLYICIYIYIYTYIHM